MSTTTITVNISGDFVRDGVDQASGPLTITNTGPGVLTVYFDCQGNTISNANNYIILNSANILFDGQLIPVNIIATGYLGFIQKTGIFTNVIIKNVIINVVPLNLNFQGTLVNNSGWVCQNNTQYITVLNCSSNGIIPNEGGGIVGSNSSNIICKNCNSSGIISFRAGGILGSYINGNVNSAVTIVTALLQHW